MTSYPEFESLRSQRLIHQLQKDGLGAWVNDPISTWLSTRVLVKLLAHHR